MMKKGILSVLIGLLALNAGASPVNFQSAFRSVKRNFNRLNFKALDDKQQIGAAVVAALFGDMLLRRNNSLVGGLASRVKGFFKWVFAPSGDRASELKTYLRTRWYEWVPLVIAAIVAYKYRHSIPGLKMISRRRAGGEEGFSSSALICGLQEQLVLVPRGMADVSAIEDYLRALADDPQIEVLRGAANNALQERSAAVENFLDTVVSSGSLPVDGKQFSLSPDELRAWVDSNGGALKPLVERLPVNWPAFVTLKDYLTHPVTNTAVGIVLDPSVPEEKLNAIVDQDFISSTLAFFETAAVGKELIAPFLTMVESRGEASLLPQWVVNAYCSRPVGQPIDQLAEWLKTCRPDLVQSIADGLCTRFESSNLHNDNHPTFLPYGLYAIMAREELDAVVVQRIGTALVTAYQQRDSIDHRAQISRDAQNKVKTVFRRLMGVAPQHMSALRYVDGIHEIETAVERDKQIASSSDGIGCDPNAWN